MIIYIFFILFKNMLYIILYQFMLKLNENIILDKVVNNMSIIDNDFINNIYRNLDNLLYKYISYSIDLDIYDYDVLINDNIDKEYIEHRINKLKLYRKKLFFWKKQPYIEQRSEKWHELRKNCLTASDLHEGISKNNYNLAKKKAGVLISNIDYINIAPLKWGTMFEDMATRCYKQINNNIKIHDFGLIVNDCIKNFGASPDGISDLGIMIEIKCPYSRKIKKNFIPEKYYYQIQGQLAVCELNECDYIECEFKILDTEEEYIEYINNNNLSNIKHGIIAEYNNLLEKNYYYLYSDEYLNHTKSISNIQEKINNLNDPNLNFIKVSRWVLKDIYVQRVYFNENLWNSIPDKITNFWNNVIECKKLPIEYKNKSSKKYNFINDN